MAAVLISFDDPAMRFECRALTGRERVGEAAQFSIEALSPEVIDRGAVVGQACLIEIEAEHGRRVIRGVVLSISAVATSGLEAVHRYKLLVRSKLAVLELKRRSKVFQHLSVPEIISEVLKDGGVDSANIKVSTREAHAPREYVVQYAETDAAFLRRMCEEEGTYFRFEQDTENETFVIEDTSGAAPDALPEPLSVVDRTKLRAPGATAWSPRVVLRRRPGKVTLRDYNQESPALRLEAVEMAGTEIEKSVEVYEAPGRFADPALGKTRASRRLEGLRADASTLTFETSAIAIAPGTRIELEAAPDLPGTARPEGEWFVVGLEHRWTSNDEEYGLAVEAIPLGTPYRLPRVTPRPRVHGLHTTFVTGAPGQEIHVDSQGRVRVRFVWDREAPDTDKSSLPIRVMQPNTPGSMLLPRVGWEVLVAFEDGDPDRPYVLGRTYNAKQPPPYSLPDNKTVTALGTLSSPGGGGQNVIRFDDAAGRQNISFAASFAKTTTVANNMMTQTAKNEALTVKASQSRTVGATEDVSVTEAYVSTLGSQSATVGGVQKIYVKGDASVGVGSESVLIGGACLEKVGNPVAGAKNLAVAAALSGAGALGTAGGLIAKGVSLGQAAYAGYQRGGLKGAAAGAGMGVLGMAAESIPGGGAVLGAIQEAVPPPWEEKKQAPGEQAAGGGAGGASDTAGPKGPGPGHRNTTVKGAMTELIGGALGIVSPGSIGWTTIGASTLLIGGSHSVKAGQAGSRTMGAAIETLGSLNIKTGGNITRDIKGAINTTIAGTLSSTASGKHSIKAGGALSLKVGGPLTMSAGNVTFICGGSKVAVSSSGVLFEASSITVTGKTTQSGATDHS